MMKFGGVRYNSRWDGSTWAMLGAVVIACLWPIVLDDWIWPMVICSVMLVVVLLAFLGCYYRIDGDKLVVYNFFIPTAYPIKKIKSVKPTKSILSAPATSLIHRIAISFTDRRVLKSSMPLVISPAHQDEFILNLLKINPLIDTGDIPVPKTH